MFSRRIVRISVVAALALWLQQPAALAQPADADRQGHAAQPRGPRGGRQARVREGARAAQAGARPVSRARVSSSIPVAARTHVHMGVVIIQGFKNPELGKKQFAKALAIDPSITITKSLSTPDLEEAFAGGEGRRRRAGGRRRRRRDGGGDTDTARRRRAPADGETVTRRRRRRPGFSYHTVSEVKQGSSIVVTVTVDESLKFTQADPRLPRAGDRRVPRARDGAGGRRRLPRRDPRVGHDRDVGRLLHGGAGRRRPAGRVARDRDAAAGDLVRRDGEAVVGARRSDCRAEGRRRRKRRRGRGRGRPARSSSACWSAAASDTRRATAR